MGQLIKGAVEKIPQLDVTAAKALAQQVRIPPTDMWRVRTNFSPANVFPAAFAAFWRFFLLRTGQTLAPWDRALQVIENVRERCTFRYLPEGLPGLRGPEIPIAHKIVLRTVPTTGQLIGYFEVLGVVRVGGLIAEGRPGDLLEEIYVADVFAKSDRSSDHRIDAETFDTTDWKNTGLDCNDTERLQKCLYEAQAPLHAFWQKREAKLAADDIKSSGGA